MKNKFTVVLLTLFLVPLNAYGQKDTTKKNMWVPAAIAGLNISQLALSNWTQGGENSINWTLTGNLGYNYKGEEWTFTNNLKVAYGRTKLGGSDYRTNDNELYLESVLSRKIGWAVDPYFSNIVRTTVARGFDYNKTPAAETANFFDPGYVTQSIGFTYDKLSSFQTRIGLAVQEVFANVHREYTDDPATSKVEAFKLETGIQSVTSGKFEIDKNVLFTSSLTLFSRFESLDVWDVRWDNSFIAKVNSWLNVNLGYLLIYQKDQSLKTQMKEALQLGIVYTIL